MAKLQRQVGATSLITNIFVADTTSTTGGGKTGLTNSSFTCYYKRNTGTASVAVTLDASSGVTLGTYEPSSASHGAIKEVDATNMPGIYEFQIPDNALASSADNVVLMLTGTGILVEPVEIELTATNNQSTGFGLVNASANVAQINSVSTSAVTTVKAVQGLTTADTIATYTGNTVQTGDAYARLGAPAGASVSADVAAVNSKTTNLPASPASTTNITGGTITTVTNLTNAPTSGDFTATMKTSIGTAVAASAVASVTGNVGGNVTGSVGSVTGAVGSVTAQVSANITAVNGVTVNGAGTSGSPWGP